MKVATPQRLKFSNFAFDRFPNSRCRATVVLERGEFERFEEAIEAFGAEASELRCAAQATVSALNRAVGDRCYFELLGVKAIKAFDTTVVIVAVSSRKDDETRRLVGSYLAEDDPVRGAAVAVLNATNRFLGNEIFAR